MGGEAIPWTFTKDSLYIECYKNRALSLVNWPQYTSVIGKNCASGVSYNIVVLVNNIK